jgi:hypothetical protein
MKKVKVPNVFILRFQKERKQKNNDLLNKR